MKRINYKSDFDFILRLRDCRGEEIGWPDYDWEAKLWTSTKANCFIAGCTDGVAKNCYNDGGKIHIVADNHHLGRGVLHVEFTAKLPNDLYPDADERIVVPVDLDIQLISTAAPCPESFEVELMLPYVKISWKDLTPEQIAELKQPAVDAANETREVIEEARTATTEAIRVTEDAVEATRNANSAAEEARTATSETSATNEAVKKAEAVRITNETSRVASEQARFENELRRVSAEERRATAETERANAEATRISDESLRVHKDTLRSENEAFRISHETDRKKAETKRVEAENQRVSAEESRVEAEMGRAEAEEARVSAEEKRATEFAGFKEAIEEKQDKFSTSEDLNLENDILSLAERAKRAQFDEMVSALGVSVIEPGKKYGIGSIEDLSYYEMLASVNHGNKLFERAFSHRPAAFGRFRTNLPIINVSDGESLNLSGMFCDQALLEVVDIPPVVHSGSVLEKTFSNCFNLREIVNIINVSNVTSLIDNSVFEYCQHLTFVIIEGLKVDISFADSPDLTLYSLSCIVDLAENTSPITITVHEDVFKRLIDEGNEEWNMILPTALGRGISFAMRG